jgi:hypothetical protein
MVVAEVVHSRLELEMVLAVDVVAEVLLTLVLVTVVLEQAAKDLLVVLVKNLLSPLVAEAVLELLVN